MAITQVSIDDLSTWWAAQPDNTPETAYQIEITGLTTSNYTQILDILGVYWLISQGTPTPTKFYDLSPTTLPDGITSAYFYFESSWPATPSYRAMIGMTKAPVIPEGVTIVNFTDSFSLTDVTIPSGVTSLTKSFLNCTSLVTAPAIPDTVTSMDSTFRGCTSLVNAPEIPDSVISMAWTFADCTSLVDAPVLPSSITLLYGTFNGCTSLVNAPTIPSSVTELNGAFANCTSLVNAPEIPDSVISMAWTFADCTSLTSIEIPDSVTYMYHTFEGCTSLVDTPIIPDSVTSWEGLFQNCTSLKNVSEIPSTVTTITSAFRGCTALVVGPTIPATVKSISYAFEGCTSLLKITLEGSPDTVTSKTSAFEDTPSTLVVTVEDDYLDAWRAVYSTLGLKLALQIVIITGLITLAQLKQYDTARNTKTEAKIKVETDRATEAETTLQTNIDNEATRATEAEETLQTNIDAKQDTLVSGTNIKTINSNSLLGEGDLVIDPLPSGGTTGQILTKTSDGADWENAPVTFTLPIGFVTVLDESLNANDLFDGTWIEMGD